MLSLHESRRYAPGMKIVVTASASGLAQVILPMLLADERVRLVIGIDREPGEFEHERFVQVQMGPGQPQLARVLKGVQALIHLAPALHEADRDTLLSQTQHLFRHAQAARVRDLVVVSSALLYDARAGQEHVEEDQPRAAPSGCASALALQAVEEWLDGFEQEHPQLRIVRLRPHWVLGPHSDSLLARLLRGRRHLRLPAPHPLLQCLHESDLATAVLQAVHGEMRGAFNLAASEPTTLLLLLRQARWFTVGSQPERLARRYGLDTSCAELLRRPLVLSTRRAHRELDWEPRYTALRDIIRQNR